MKIFLSRDRKTATVITDTKVFSVYHGDGNVMELVDDMLFQPADLTDRSEEITRVLFDDPQMSFVMEAA